MIPIFVVLSFSYSLLCIYYIQSEIKKLMYVCMYWIICTLPILTIITLCFIYIINLMFQSLKKCNIYKYLVYIETSRYKVLIFFYTLVSEIRYYYWSTEFFMYLDKKYIN